MQYPSPSSATTKPKTSNSLFGKRHEPELFFPSLWIHLYLIDFFFFFCKHQTTVDIIDLFYVLRTKHSSTWVATKSSKYLDTEFLSEERAGLSLHYEPQGATGPKMKETKVSCFKSNLVKVLCRGAATVPTLPFTVDTLA